ncbi:MAG: cytochrome c [Holophagales bacterium]|nr:MAG: cytochrome c [Holophagales bacterium]
MPCRALLCVFVGCLPWVGCGGSHDRPSDGGPAPTAHVEIAPAVSAQEQRGRKLFRAYCISCHSVDGRGLQSLGIDLTTSRFVARQSDAALGAFLRRGRAPDDPDNRTGRQMPGIEVLPEIGEAEVQALVAHLRAIHRPG